jgi:serine/threonine protein kinase
MVSGRVRAPELLLRNDGLYGAGVDVWAAGCSICELMLGDPLFPGNSEMEQIALILALLGGQIAEGRWPEGWRRVGNPAGVAREASARSGASNRVGKRQGLRSVLPLEGYDPLHVHKDQFETTALSDEGFRLLSRALQLDPAQRVSAASALESVWLPSGAARERGRIPRGDLEAMTA